jgi:hypothetical protein
MTDRGQVEALENLSRDERRRVRVGRRRVRRWHREKRRRLSRDDLLDYLRRNNFGSRRKMERGRKPGDPKIWDFLREFGKWSSAKTEAFGKEPFPAGFSARYLVKVVCENNLWTARLYREERRVRPDIVPSFYYVEKEFKWWGNLKYAARQYDSRLILDEYFRLKRKIGRAPTFKECRENDIAVNRLVDLFGGRRRFNEVISSLEGHCGEK